MFLPRSRVAVDRHGHREGVGRARGHVPRRRRTRPSTCCAATTRSPTGRSPTRRASTGSRSPAAPTASRSTGTRACAPTTPCPASAPSKLKLKPGPDQAPVVPHPARRRRPRHGDVRWQPGRRRLPGDPRRGRRLRRGRGHRRDGKYVVTSLKPGAYTIRNSVGFSDYVSQTKPVTLEQTTSKTVDLALDPGASVRFTRATRRRRRHPGRAAQPGRPGDEGLPGRPGRRARRAGRLPRACRRSSTSSTSARRRSRSSPPTETDFPWAQQSGRRSRRTSTTSTSGPSPLDQPSIDLTGRLNQGLAGQDHRGPAGPVAAGGLRERRPGHADGAGVDRAARRPAGPTPRTGWSRARTRVLQTTSYRDRGNKGTATGGNVATTQHSLTVVGARRRGRASSAPAGRVVKGRMQYASNGQPVIAPIGLRVFDAGDDSWLMPTVSSRQKFGKPLPGRAAAQGPGRGRLLDLEGLYDEHPDVADPGHARRLGHADRAGHAVLVHREGAEAHPQEGRDRRPRVVEVLLRGLDVTSG